MRLWGKDVLFKWETPQSLPGVEKVSGRRSKGGVVVCEAVHGVVHSPDEGVSSDLRTLLPSVEEGQIRLNSEVPTFIGGEWV